MVLGKYVNMARKALSLTQRDMALKAGVGLRFVRDVEQGEKSLRTDKVNQVLQGTSIYLVH